jgi:hypothetical protein
MLEPVIITHFHSRFVFGPGRRWQNMPQVGPSAAIFAVGRLTDDGTGSTPQGMVLDIAYGGVVASTPSKNAALSTDVPSSSSSSLGNQRRNMFGRASPLKQGLYVYIYYVLSYHSHSMQLS